MNDRTWTVESASGGGVVARCNVGPSEQIYLTLKVRSISVQISFSRPGDLCAGDFLARRDRYRRPRVSHRKSILAVRLVPPDRPCTLPASVGTCDAPRPRGVVCLAPHEEGVEHRDVIFVLPACLHWHLSFPCLGFPPSSRILSIPIFDVSFSVPSLILQPFFPLLRPPPPPLFLTLPLPPPLLFLYSSLFLLIFDHTIGCRHGAEVCAGVGLASWTLLFACSQGCGSCLWRTIGCQR